MLKLVEVIIAAVVSFAATNLDDILVLMVLFTQVDNSKIQRKHIVGGQYLGFLAIIIASLPGFFGGLILDQKWIGILGLVPIIIGVTQLINSQSDGDEIQGVSEDLLSSPKDAPNITSIVSGVLSKETYKVATITFANGGDNIGIYVPLFASSNWMSLGVILGVFFIMVGTWCYVAYKLTNHPRIANILTNRGQALVPFILIGLGIFILINSEAYQLLIPTQ